MSLRKFLTIAFGFASILGAKAAFGQAGVVPTTVTVQAPAVVQVNDAIGLTAKVSHSGAPCPAPAYVPATPGTVSVDRGIAIQYPLSGAYFADRRYVSCSDGVYTDGADLSAPAGSTPGDITFTVSYSGAAGLAPSVSAPVTVKVVDGFSGAVGQGVANLKVSGIASEFYCGTHFASIADGPPPGAPAGFTFANGYASYAFTGCKTECNGICPPPPDDPKWAGQTVTMQLPQPPAPGSKVLVYAPGGGVTTPIWRVIDPQIDGNTVTFVITGNGGESELRGLVAIASGDGTRSDLQDLWWGGMAENGWGLDIAQQGDRIFAGLFVYRNDGAPTWVVMPGGTWDSTHTVFSGSLYGASGSYFREYDASRLNVLPSGTARLTFSGTGAATFDYTIGTASGRKSIVRQPIGTTAQPVQGPHAGLWWGGAAQNGWGITIAHQDDTVFAVWYTYDLTGTATWFVMPGSSRIGSSDNWSYVGKLYRTTGSPFLGGTYDPSKLVVTPVGQMGFTFYGPDVAYMTYTVDGQAGRATLYKQPF